MEAIWKPHTILLKNGFENRIKKMEDDREAMLAIVKTTRLSTLLPDELLLVIVGFVCPEQDYYFHIMFQRKNIYDKDTYYSFSGTKARLERSILALKKEVEVFKVANPEDTLADTPFDGNCRWGWAVYEDTVKFAICYEGVLSSGAQASNSGSFELRDISRL